MAQIKGYWRSVKDSFLLKVQIASNKDYDKASIVPPAKIVSTKDDPLQ